ncbi:hypothetical protein PR202_gb14455 [Eleusine coracana subsp. coracana]|uniref:DNA ligase n=1 Tax=Eleusine coracana subsp. coracana TaxID=191504 RepID=A0AAV5EWD5_ELECO|nr:hypothetical protein PR202_gb14455 [Eleusine coracana subsp. coracana]
MAARVRFGLLVAMFQAMSKDRTSAKKRSRLRVFLDRAYGPSGRDDYFSALRLVLPGLDRERGTYGLKEATLAAVLVDALGIAKDSPDAVRLINWRRGGGFRNAGNFSLVAAEVLQRRQGMTSGGLTIKEVNDALDRLAATENRSEKAAILSGLIKKTNALEMKWLLMIILKDLKLGISEKSIFHEFHPDAEDLFNVTCDLKFVCEKLNDRSQRHKRQDIEVGKAVRPQLAMRTSNASAAWKKLHGKQVVAECKFDGDRIQIHKNGEEIHFFSRSFLDHSEYAPGMANVIKENILVDRIQETEIEEALKRMKSGKAMGPDDVAFDILYAGDTSVIHQSLIERHEILKKVVKPAKGRLEVLVPAGDEPCWSIVAHNLEDVEKFFKETIDNREEGIVLKDLESKWEPGDRSGKWLKLKPDYIHAGADLDVLIIGGYYGSGRRGGEVAQFLVGLAVPSDDNSYPKRFLSFCRVGTGLSDEELNALVSKLKPYFRSVIVSITSDIRTIKSEVFAAPYCLRFPRIQRVRYDKPWHECLDVQAFVDIVHSSNGTMHKAADDNSMKTDNTKQSRTNKKGEKKKKSAYILFLADFARHKFPEEIDPYGDYYYWDIDISDVKQIFSNIDKVAVNSDMVNRYKKKHCGDERFCFFGGCCVYFHHAPLINADYNVISDLALKRVKQDLTMHGGQVCNSIVPATHLVVVSVLQTYNFDILYKSIPPAERRYLHDKRLHVVNNKWLEDSVEKQMKLPETDYNLKPDTLEELQIERSEENAEPLDHKHEEQEEEVVRSHAKHVPRKRSRPASSSRPARAAPRPVRRTRARKGSQLVKIDDVESEESGPGEYQCDQKPETDHISMVDGNNSEKDRKPPRAAPRPIRRARMRRGNQHAKIDDEFEESDLGERDQEDQKLDGECISKMEENISGPPPGAQVFTLGEQEPKVGESNTVEEKPQSPFQRTSAVEMMSSAPGEKMEQMIDPLQAMLLDLIPALRQTKAEDSSRVPAAKVEKVIPRGGSSTSNSGIPLPQAGTSGVPAPDPNAAPPPKKKKVSYKDVAGELLKDW